MSALMIVPIAVSRNTGATASWIRRVMSKTWESQHGRRSYAALARLQRRDDHRDAGSPTMMPTMMSVRFCFTQGMLPKK